MKTTYITLPILFFIASSLLGCSGMNSDFGCNEKANNGCTPVSEVNAKAETGFYDNQTSGGGNKIPTSQTFFHYVSEKNSGESDYQGVTPLPGEPVRFGETIQRIWIAPYQDLANDYHEPSYVYMVLEKPHWIGLPEKEITGEALGQDD